MLRTSLGQIVRGDRVARGAADKLLDARLGILHVTKDAHELGRIGDLPDGPDRDLDLLAILGGDVHEFFRLAGSVPDLEGLGQPHHLLDQRELEVQARLGAAGDRLAELQEHGQLALVDGVEDGLDQGDGQHQSHADQNRYDPVAVHRLVSPLGSRFKSGKRFLSSESMIVLSFTP